MPGAQAVLWALVGLPGLAGALLLVAGRRADNLAAPVAVAAAAVDLPLAVAAAVARPEVVAPMLAGLPVRLAVDGLSAVLVVTVAFVVLAVTAFAAGEAGAGAAGARFFGLLSLFASAMLVTVTATGLLGLLMAWEVMGAVSYALIGYWWADARRVRSASLAFVTTRAADLGLYLAAGAALAGGAVALRLSGLATLEGAWRDAAVAGVLVAALGKSAQLPFSFWLSRAMAGPTPVSALLHSAAMVAAGGYLLLRVEPALMATGWAAPAAAWVGVLTALLLGVVALVQTDLKQLLAASTCAQIGLVVLAAGVGSLAGGTLQFAAHAATKSLLFLCAGAWLVTLGRQDLPGLRGAARDHPTVGAAFSAGALTLAGLPPLSLWVAKEDVLTAALEVSPALYAVAVAAATLTAAYAARALVTVWLPRAAPPETAPGRTERAEDRPEEAAGPAEPGRAEKEAGSAKAAPGGRARVPPARWLPLAVLAAAAVLLGGAVVPAVSAWWASLLGVPPGPRPAVGPTAATTVLGIAALAATGWVTARRPPTGPLAAGGVTGWFGNWLRLERLAEVAVLRPVLALANALAALDDRVVARGVLGCAAAGLWSARATGDRLEPLVEGAVHATATAARTLGHWARRPQTGLLHHYYAQALTLLLALTIVLLLAG